MILQRETSNYIESKVAGKSYSDKQYVQYIYELIILENYIISGRVGTYYGGFTIDLLRDKYWGDYLELVKEIKGIQEYEYIKNNHIKKEIYISTGIDFSYTGILENGLIEWIELGGKK
ncbi:MAG: hypothetical protein Q8K30_06415 [Candidatus Gracilibacteria bacterium]|nr:hypothetical protein [Candidatus Gracilibacteria bacterium]